MLSSMSLCRATQLVRRARPGELLWWVQHVGCFRSGPSASSKQRSGTCYELRCHPTLPGLCECSLGRQEMRVRALTCKPLQGPGKVATVRSWAPSLQRVTGIGAPVQRTGRIRLVSFRLLTSAVLRSTQAMCAGPRLKAWWPPAQQRVAAPQCGSTWSPPW